MRRLVQIAFAAFALLLAACSKNDPGPAVQVQGHRIWIANEGNFTFGNGSLGRYDPNRLDYIAQAYESVNGTVLGDVVQSIAFIDSLALIVVNNSGRIAIVRRSDLKSVGAITGLVSPRYAIGIGNGRALVSELYDQRIYIVDVNSALIERSIPVQGWTEEMLRIGDSVYIPERPRPELSPGDDFPEQRQVLVFDIGLETIVDSIQLDQAPTGRISSDGLSGFYLSTVNDADSGIAASIVHIEPRNRTESSILELTDASRVIRDQGYIHELDRVYHLQADGLYDQSAIRLLQFQQAYGLGRDPQNGDLYIADALDYLSQGRVYRFAYDLTPKDTIDAGIIPAYFAFE